MSSKYVFQMTFFVALLMLCLILFVTTFQFINVLSEGDPGAAFYPRILLGIMVLSLIGLMINARRTEISEHTFSVSKWGMVILLVYAFAFSQFGYVGPTLVFLVVFSRLLKISWKTSLLVSTIFTLSTYLTFAKLLNVYF